MMFAVFVSLAVAVWALVQYQRERARALATETKLTQQTARAAGFEAALAQECKKGEEKLELQRGLQQDFEQRFKGLAAQVLELNTTKFETNTRVRLGEMAEAFRRQVLELQQKVEQSHQLDTKDRVELRTELKHMVDATRRVEEDATNLTRALTGDRRAQGAWGELVLDRVLEQCGLREGFEYRRQKTFTNDEQERFRPDVVVDLPGARSVIVDAKVSLTAYQLYVAADDDSAADVLARHVESVRNHVRHLADKRYWQLNELDAQDYVLMFMPIEAAFAEAAKADPELFGYAFERKVILVSPVTLVATLRTIEHTWRVERQNENARKIVDQAGKLYDKFVGFATDLDKVGDALQKAQDAYGQAHGKLATGRGNLVSHAHKLSELGIKMKKPLPRELVDVADDALLPCTSEAANDADAAAVVGL